MNTRRLRIPFRRSRAARPAFSLLEVLVALALLGVLLGSVYAFITTLFDRESRALEEAAKSQVATMVFDRLEADLMTAIASAGDRAGLEGRRDRLTVAQRAVLPGSPDAPRADLQFTEIRFDPRLRRLFLSRRADADDRIETEADVLARAGAEGGSAAPLPAEADPSNPGVRTDRLGDEPYPVPVRDARFRYFDGENWSDRCSSSREMPAAIELAIWFGGADDDPPPPGDALSPMGGTDPNAIAGGDFGADPFGTGAASAPAGFGGPGTGDPLADPYGASAYAADSLDAERPLGPPDRVRLITIPDARLPRTIARSLDRGATP